MKSSTKWFFRELSYTLKCRVCVALLDVVAKLSIGQNRPPRPAVCVPEQIV